MDDNSYLQEILQKFDFIQGVWVTDYEGALITSLQRNEDNNGEAEDKNGDSENRNNKIKVSLSYQFNSAIDQINKIEKWKTKYLVTVYDTITIFQAKINKTILSHFICDSKNFNYEIMKEILKEVQEKLQKVEKEIDNLTQNNENN